MMPGCASGFAENEPYLSILPSVRGLGAAIRAEASKDAYGKSLGDVFGKTAMQKISDDLRRLFPDG